MSLENNVMQIMSSPLFFTIIFHKRISIPGLKMCEKCEAQFVTGGAAQIFGPTSIIDTFHATIGSIKSGTSNGLACSLVNSLPSKFVIERASD